MQHVYNLTSPLKNGSFHGKEAEEDGWRLGGRERRQREMGGGKTVRERGRVGGCHCSSFQALEVATQERRKISCCFKKERGDRERVWSCELLNACVLFFSLPSSSLHGLLIWDLFKSRTAPQEDFSLLGKGNPAPPLLHYRHPHTSQHV